jgi:hypothetical protein
MPVRFSIAPLIAVIAVALAPGATANVSARPRACAPRQAHIVMSDRQAQVYARGGTTFACARRGGARLRLGTTASCIAHDLAQRVALRGMVVAVARETCGIDTGSTEIIVWRLGRRLPLARGPAAVALRPESYTTVTALLISRRGNAAWIAATHSLGAAGGQVEVRSLIDGRDIVLGSGSDIATRSLRLRGTELTWRDGGTDRSASLP